MRSREIVAGTLTSRTGSTLSPATTSSGAATPSFGNRGDDDIYGGDGRDRIVSGRGDGFVDVQGDGKVDRVDCGSGRDVVRANPEERLAGDCEVEKANAGPK